MDKLLGPLVLFAVAMRHKKKTRRSQGILQAKRAETSEHEPLL
ncbi:hypothetical protein [Reyranella soli]|nr:hypothetical protein [Reyranella soli]